MNRHYSSTSKLLPEPRRALRADFTAHTIKHAAVAKRRAYKKERLHSFFEEPFSMKSFNFLRTVPGAAIAAAVVMTTGASAYALTNWFNGSVVVHQDHSVFSVDLSSCKGPLPAGVENPDRHNVRFVIMNDGHISATDLQQDLLAECEYQSIVDFYRSQPATSTASINTGTIVAINSSDIQITYTRGNNNKEKTLSLTQDLTSYNAGKAVSLSALQPGDHIAFVTPAQSLTEGVDPLDTTTSVQSIFKTQYNLGNALTTSKNGFYEINHIMPLDAYQQLHK